MRLRLTYLSALLACFLAGCAIEPPDMTALMTVPADHALRLDAQRPANERSDLGLISMDQRSCHYGMSRLRDDGSRPPRLEQLARDLAGLMPRITATRRSCSTAT